MADYAVEEDGLAVLLVAGRGAGLLSPRGVNLRLRRRVEVHARPSRAGVSPSLLPGRVGEHDRERTGAWARFSAWARIIRVPHFLF